MTVYKPQPGTICHRAMAWLTSMAKVRPDYEPTTVEICEGLDIEMYGFTPSMHLARLGGLVHTSRSQSGSVRVMHWKLGDGTPDPTLIPASLTFTEPEEPLPQWKAPKFHPVAFGNQVLVKGVTVINGVVVFTPQQVMQIAQAAGF